MIEKDVLADEVYSVNVSSIQVCSIDVVIICIHPVNAFGFIVDDHTHGGEHIVPTIAQGKEIFFSIFAS